MLDLDDDDDDDERLDERRRPWNGMEVTVKLKLSFSLVCVAINHGFLRSASS